MKARIQRIINPLLKETVGIFSYENFYCNTLELPWLENATGISCIPDGYYKCRKIQSPANGDCIEITNVVDRTYIQIHIANFKRDIEGCVAVGSSLVDIDGDGLLDVANSSKTFKGLMAVVPQEFYLEISSVR